MTDTGIRRALITRPEEDSAEIAAALRRRGMEAVAAPLMEIVQVDADIEADAARAQAILFTSRNGVRAFCRLSDRRDATVYAVGDSTARLARESGFADVESAGGNSADLARLVVEKADPGNGPLLHAAGETVAGELAETLGDAGFEVLRRPLYRAEAVGALPDAARAALETDALEAVLLFSPRTARLFRERVDEAGLAGRCRRLTALCLSQAVADALDPDGWRAVRVAARPTTESLLAALDESRADGPPDADGLEPAAETAQKPPMPWSAAGAAAAGTATTTGTGEGTDMTTPDKTETTDSPAEDGAVPETETAADSGDSAPAETKPAQKPSRSSQAQKPSRSSGAAVAWTLVAVLVVLGAAFATLPSWRDSLPAPIRDRLAGGGGSGALEAVQKQLADARAAAAAQTASLDELKAANASLAETVRSLQAGLAETTQALAALRDAPPAQAAEPSADPALAARLSGIEKDLAALREAQSAALAGRTAALESVGAQIAALEKRLAGAEESLAASRRAAAASGKSDTLALAAGQFREALSRSGPFAAELATLKRVSGGDAAITGALAPIEAFAEKGIPTETSLLGAVPGLVSRAAEAGRQPQDGGWIDRTIAGLRGWISVRRIDGKGDDMEAALARAEMAASHGDLETAVVQLSSLDGPAAKAVSGWLTSAQARLAADAAAAAVGRAVLGGLSGGG